jgi:lipoyl(octanoyl) transferase
VVDDLQVAEDVLKERGIELHISPRGGQATLHTPGQLVIYPCVHLTRIGIGVREYVSLLERTTQNFLKDLRIESTPNPEEPGLYTKKGKIAFFGIRVTHAITSHGIAINVTNDLSLFKLIRSCGVEGETFDSVSTAASGSGSARKKSPPPGPLKRLFALWVNHFRKELEKIS